MCTLMGALGFAVSAAQSVLTFKAQQAQYNAQLAAFQANAEAAGKAYDDQTAQEGLRMQQAQTAAVDKKMELYKESLRAKGTTLASSEGGGLSEEMLLQDIERQRADYSDIVGYNLRNEMQQSRMNMEGMHAEATSRGQSGNPGPAPSSLSLGLGLAGAALGAYDNYHVRRAGDIRTAASYGLGAGSAGSVSQRTRSRRKITGRNLEIG